MPKRLAQIVVLLVATVTMLGAGSPSNRFDKLGHKLMCTCSCAEILLECNHMGCPDSPGLIDDLRNQVATGASDASVLHWFADKYGATVLASPIRGGFDLVAWIMPFAVLGLGVGAVVWLVRHWRDRQPQAAFVAGPHGSGDSSAASALRDRIRQETTYEP